MLKHTWQKATVNFRIYAYIAEINKESLLPAEEVGKIQFTRLKKLLCDVYQTHPFYQERFDASHFDPFKMDDLSEIEKYLSLRKKIIVHLLRANWNKMKSVTKIGIKIEPVGQQGFLCVFCVPGMSVHIC